MLTGHVLADSVIGGGNPLGQILTFLTALATAVLAYRLNKRDNDSAAAKITRARFAELQEDMLAMKSYSYRLRGDVADRGGVPEQAPDLKSDHWST